MDVLIYIIYLSAPEAPRIDVTKCSRSDSAVALVVLPSCACQIDEYSVHYHTDKQASLELEVTGADLEGGGCVCEKKPQW